MKLTRAFLRWMRQVLPRDTIVATAVICALVVEGFHLWCQLGWGHADEAFFARVRLLIQVVSVSVYGAHRVLTFHPANDPEYRQWLECSPWTPRMPLPMGPVHLVPQDLVIVVASIVLTRDFTTQVLYIPIAFLVSYVVTLAITVRMTGQTVWAYLLGIAIGGGGLSIQQPLEALMTMGATTALSLVALQSSLRAFPWQLPWFAQFRDWVKSQEARKELRTGWPFDILSPPENPRAALIEPADGLGISLLAGWWYFVLLWQISSEAAALSAFAVCQFALVACLVRLGTYLRNHRPPISLCGRLTTGSPWQRGFDEIFIAPLLAPLLCIVVPVAVVANHLAMAGPRMPLDVPRWMVLAFAPCGMTGFLMILLLAGPRLGAWKLAGRHRIVFDQPGQQTGLGQSSINKDFVQTG